MGYIYRPREMAPDHTCKPPQMVNYSYRWTRITAGTIWQCETCETYWYARGEDTFNKWVKVRWYHGWAKKKIQEATTEEAAKNGG